MVTDQITEVIFVGLPGPTHHYGGLSDDNVASAANRGSMSNPRQAALQALELVKLLRQMGVAVAVLPPQLRPHMPLLRQHFQGEDDDIIRKAVLSAPALLEKASSASAMWTANAATVTPVPDSEDGKLHITAANLFTNLHRRIEAEETYRVLKAIFAEVPNCVVHPPLSAAMGMCDEGAANHMRLSPNHTMAGLNLFVYGADGGPRDPKSARQTVSASRAILAQHHISEDHALFLRQNPDVIGQGVFHNDVIAVSNEHVLLVHEQAYDRGFDDLERISDAFHTVQPDHEPVIIVIDEEDLSVEEAVHSYFFNSQIVTKPDGAMALIAPAEVQLLYNGWGSELMDRIVDDDNNPIDEVVFIDLRQSMRNGGGPACLRLRVPMTGEQLAAMAASSGVMADDRLLEALDRIVSTHYPERLTTEGLGNPDLLQIAKTVQGELSQALRLPLLP